MTEDELVQMAAARADLQVAGDPSTPLRLLAEIVRSRPDLRAGVAGNPSTYPELLEWLGMLGDPRVDAALTARQVPGPTGPAGEPTPPSSTPEVPGQRRLLTPLVVAGAVAALALGGAAGWGVSAAIAQHSSGAASWWVGSAADNR